MKLYAIILSYLTLMCFGMIDNGRGPAYPFILEAFKVDPSSGSLVFTLSSILALLTNFSSKFWMSMLGAKKSLQMSLFMQFVGASLYALSDQLALPFIFVLLASVFFGIGAGASNVCISIVITKSTNLENRRKVFSGLHSVYAISSLVAPLIFSFMLKLTSHWSLFFYFLSALPMISLIASFFFPIKIEGEDQISEMKTVNVPLITRARVGLMLALNVTAEVLISSRLVFYLQNHLDQDPHKASLALSLFFLALLIGRFIPAIIHLPFRSLNIMLFSAVVSLITVTLGLYINAYFLSVAGASMALFFPTGMDWISKKYHEKSDFMMASALNYVGLVLILMHFSFGFITDQLGLHKAMHLSPMALALSLILIISFKKEAKS